MRRCESGRTARSWQRRPRTARGERLRPARRLRNFFKAEDPELFEAISEYTSGPDVTGARNRFFQRRARVLLYTERSHFYHRHRIRGIRVR